MSQMCKTVSVNGMPGVVPVTFPLSYPYQMLQTDRAIIADTTTPVTIILPLNPVSGQTLSIKDNTGLAGSNPITIQGNGKMIDSQADYTIQFNWGFVGLIYNGTQWNVINN